MSKRKANRLPKVDKPRLLAKWQRALLWSAWLAFFTLCIANSDRGYWGLGEFALLGLGALVTIWSLNNPLGRERVLIEAPAFLRGEFHSRTNWPVVIFGFVLTLGSIAGGVKIGRDLGFGFTTVWGVFEDFALFFLEWTIELLSKGFAGDVTDTKMYTLVFLIPIGAPILLYNLLPLLFRGCRFRVGEDGQILVFRNQNWQPLAIGNYRKVTADGISFDFSEPAGNHPVIRLPQQRVFCANFDTRVPARVLGQFFRERLEAAGFVVDAKANETTGKTWTYRQPDTTLAAAE